MMHHKVRWCKTRTHIIRIYRSLITHAQMLREAHLSPSSMASTIRSVVVHAVMGRTARSMEEDVSAHLSTHANIVQKYLVQSAYEQCGVCRSTWERKKKPNACSCVGHAAVDWDRCLTTCHVQNVTRCSISRSTFFGVSCLYKNHLLVKKQKRVSML